MYDSAQVVTNAVRLSEGGHDTREPGFTTSAFCLLPSAL